MKLASDDLEIHYRPTLEELGGRSGMLGTIFRNAQAKIQDLSKLRRLIVDLIDKEQCTMLNFVAALFRAMGYCTRGSPPESDRDVDVLASADRLGLQEPWIKVEVKHQPNTAMGSQEVRSLNTGHRALYVSTGGFSKEAKYEAERATILIILIDLRELAQLADDNCDSFDVEGKVLLPP